jgi:hypothetical protein
LRASPPSSNGTRKLSLRHGSKEHRTDGQNAFQFPCIAFDDGR